MRFDPPRAGVLNRAVNLVLSACKTVFTENLECIVLKGSAVKGDFIRGYSDFDFHVFLKPMVMDSERAPKVEDALRFQKAFGDVRPRDFGASQFQIYFINSRKYPSDWVPPAEGTYRVLWGSLPSTAREVDDSTYLYYASQFLAGVEYDKLKIVERFVDKPNDQISPIVRLLGATVKGHMYSVSMLLTLTPRAVLRLRLDELIPIVEEGIGSKGCFSAFFDLVSNWLLIEQDYKRTRDAFREGVEALGEIACWHRKRSSDSQ